MIFTFANTDAAERVLAAAGFSFSPTQRDDPRGLLWDRNVVVAKWRNLTETDRGNLHGIIERRGGGPDAPVEITLTQQCLEEERHALRDEHQKDRPTDVQT